MTGIPEAFARFRSDLDAAVTRGRRAAAAADAVTAAQRARNREAAERAGSGRVEAARHEPTSGDVRRVATGFRERRGLPVDRLPSAEELLAPPESQKRTEGDANSAPPPPPSGSRAVAGPSGRLPPNRDDDEDFSQARILY
ncbi:hypothetical protein [Saccharothrix algeriensis]|uniref:Uncharacterized protein n=1 Tax=Saccharothrix algeriensis TaxID=173560 RepID=A0A8T8HS75_9PSEU|nr:hypothetical protein [Saccharothrix algeriensis]MBM7812727.1 hypothetical protein [Saccharothrix algeriensis]QTR01408.1 hypothetical protein J7S33_18520 [Saccharothrix algeriensis]